MTFPASETLAQQLHALGLFSLEARARAKEFETPDSKQHLGLLLMAMILDAQKQRITKFQKETL
jgi:hypothetical protein